MEGKAAVHPHGSIKAELALSTPGRKGEEAGSKWSVQWVECAPQNYIYLESGEVTSLGKSVYRCN